MAVMDHSGCAVCGGDLVAGFRHPGGWGMACSDCLMSGAADAHPAPDAVAVLAWPDAAGEMIVLSIGGEAIMLPVADARRVAGALAGALALSDGTGTFGVLAGGGRVA